MILDENDAKLFYKLNWGLLHYINQKHPVFKGLEKPVFKGSDLDKVGELHKKIVSNPELIDSFVSENPLGLSREELDIVKGWKNFIEGNFLILSHTKEHSIFLPVEGEKAYGVLGIMSTIEEMTPPILPLYCWTILLPFKGKIIHCGIIAPAPIHFGGSIKQSIKEDFQKAKSKYGIITSLNGHPAQSEKADEEMLKYYLKSERRRMESWEEINQLLKKNPSLTKTYHLELAKSHSRALSKQLREKGLSGWFAVLDDLIIASGKSRNDLAEQIERMIPQEKREWVYVFEVRGE